VRRRCYFADSWLPTDCSDFGPARAKTRNVRKDEGPVIFALEGSERPLTAG
jgi:hypothetical protein